MRLGLTFVLLAVVCAHTAYGVIDVPLQIDKVSRAGSDAVALSIPVGGPLTMTFTTNTTDAEIALCFQRGFVPQNGVCTFSLKIQPDGSIAPYTPPKLWEGTYYVTAVTNDTGVVFLDAVLHIDSCPTDKIELSDACFAAPRLSNTSDLSFPVTTLATVSVYFTIQIVPTTTFPSLISLSYGGVNASKVTIKAAYGNNHLDSNLAINVTLNTNGATDFLFPLKSVIPGVWYFEAQIVPLTTGFANFSYITDERCESGDGQFCTYKIANLNADSVQQAVGAELTYTSYQVSPPNQWRIGVSTLMGAAYNSALSIYIAAGYVPYRTLSGDVIADWTAGCTLSGTYCSQVATIQLPSSTSTYFIALSYRNASLASTQALLWVSTPTNPCPKCDHGNCLASATEYGICKCSYGYADINCKRAVTSFRIQIMVVIIIGALLLLTAIIGLVAWFISKRRASKTTGYERV